MAATKPVRVVVEIYPREVGIYLFAAGGGETAKPIEQERFGLLKHAPDISQAAVGRDVFDLLYQCASDATGDT